MIVETFAGPGGWAQGLHLLGLKEDVAFDRDLDACLTRHAAGFADTRADVAKLEPLEWAPEGGGFIASPPCQSFSQAGRGLGLDDVRGQLVYEVIRWLEAWNTAGVGPSWVACEQVKEVLPLWRLFAETMHGMGYKTWTGLVNAADYGVPQTRKRAILMASRKPFTAPAPTHAQNPSTDLFGTSHKPWVTMADALGWACEDGTWKRYKALRVGSEKGTYVPTRRTMDQPAPTLAFGKDVAQVVWEVEEVPDDQLWATERPSTTIVGSFKPEMVAAPGWRKPGDKPRQDTPGSVRIEPYEAGILQSFPIDFPWRGSRTKVFQQIGNAIPPVLAAAILKPLVEANT